VAEDLAAELDSLLASSRALRCWYLTNVPEDLRVLVDDRVARGHHSWTRYVRFLTDHGVTGATTARLVAHFSDHKHE